MQPPQIALFSFLGDPRLDLRLDVLRAERISFDPPTYRLQRPRQIELLVGLHPSSLLHLAPLLNPLPPSHLMFSHFVLFFCRFAVLYISLFYRSDHRPDHRLPLCSRPTGAFNKELLSFWRTLFLSSLPFDLQLLVELLNLSYLAINAFVMIKLKVSTWNWSLLSSNWKGSWFGSFEWSSSVRRWFPAFINKFNRLFAEFSQSPNLQICHWPVGPCDDRAVSKGD